MEAGQVTLTLSLETLHNTWLKYYQFRDYLLLSTEKDESYILKYCIVLSYTHHYIK